VSYDYPDGRGAVAGVSLAMAPGESVGLLGPNGAGKTTLLYLIAGLLEPRAGTIEIFGGRYGAGRDRDLRRRLGIVFQETDDQLFSPTVRDDVAFGPLNFDFPAAAVGERVREALRQTGLQGYEERAPHHLSSGEKRRAALATVLSYAPDILLLDEPSNDLDPRARKGLVRLLRASREARLIASHDLELIARVCDRVLLMDAGRLVADAPAVEILCDAARLEAHGLEVPLGLHGLRAEDLRARLADG
jgi:cobalt/nickel transport system ATP-binding protein